MWGWLGWWVAALAADLPVVAAEGTTTVQFERGETSWVGALQLGEAVDAIGVAVQGEPGLTLSVRSAVGGVTGASGAGEQACLIWGVGGFEAPRAGPWEVRIERRERGAAALTLDVRRGVAPVAAMWRERRAEAAATALEGVDGELFDGLRLPVIVPADPGYLTYVVEVPGGVRDLTVELEAPRGGLELHAKRGGPMEDYGDLDVVDAAAKTRDERLRLGAGGDAPLKRGLWYIDVFNPFDEQRAATISLRFEASDPIGFLELPTRLVPGRVAELRVEGQEHRHAPLVLRVPESAQSVTLQVLAAPRDIDLYVQPERAMSDWAEARWSGLEDAHNERLHLTREQGLVTGDLYVDVVVAGKAEPASSFGVVATFDGEEPEDHPLLRLPELRVAPDAPLLERVAAATVRLVGAQSFGSGVIVDPRGLVLTAAHVLEDEQGLGAIGLDTVLALATSPERAPRELLRAKVVASDPDLDLALLQVVSDLAGRPLPDGYLLPSLPISDARTLRLGEALLTAGYPSVGSRRTVATVTVTQGVVSGFERGADDQLAWIKTDARMNSGASGGPVLRADGSVVGVVNESLWSDDDVLWFSRPLSLVPPGWWQAVSREP